MNLPNKLAADRFVPNANNKDTYYLEHVTRYRFAKPYILGKKVLDLGCGTGYGSAEAIKMGASSVVGVDISNQAIHFAQKNFKNKELVFQKANATSLPFKNSSFDTVLSFEVIEHIKNYPLFIDEAMRVLKKGGYFIFSTPNAAQYRAGTSPYHFKEFTKAQLQNIFKTRKLPITLFGQTFKNDQFITSQKQYFQRYQHATFGGNKLIKKLLHFIPSSLKVAIYKTLWQQVPEIGPKDIMISKKQVASSITLLGICHKI